VEVVTKIAPIALALIMLGLGLGLTVQDFIRVVKNPKDFIIGLICQLIILPIIAYLLIFILKTPVELALGVMIIAAAPGGVTSNVMTKFAKGDVALSISLTAIISLISIISVPFIILQSSKLLGISNISQHITMTSIAIKMAGVVTVPVILGMVIRKFANKFIISNISNIEKITGILFIIVFAAVWIEERENIFSYIAQAGLVALLLNIVMMIIAYYIAKIFATGIEQRKCIAIECGLQNGTLAVFVATQIFNEIIYIIPTAAYALIMYITAFIFMYLVKKTI
tara:strand:- start:2975 stop:3823 length:849 start_codon:yes stop_codon:yes gene_type:complete